MPISNDNDGNYVGYFGNEFEIMAKLFKDALDLSPTQLASLFKSTSEINKK